MSNLSEEILYLLGLEWANFQIGSWMHSNLPHLIDVYSLKNTRKLVMTRILPYDVMLKELGSELPTLEEREPASFQFYRQIGALVIPSTRTTQDTSSASAIAQSILDRYLNRCHAEICKVAASFRSSSNMMGNVPGDLSRGNDNNYCSKKAEDRSSTRGHFDQSPEELPMTQQTCDDFIYTSALKELGDKESCLPRYTLKRMMIDPPNWRATVQYRDLQSFAEASSKKAAKHFASKSLWLQMGQGPLGA